MSEGRICPHCGKSLERYEDPLAVKLLSAMTAERDKMIEALKSCPCQCNPRSVLTCKRCAALKSVGVDTGAKS